MAKLFKIILETLPYTPLSKKEEYKEVQENLSSNKERGCNTNIKLYISPNAQHTIFNHISWGKTTNKNIVEQGGILLGHTYIDDETGIQFGEVEQAVSGYSGRGTSGSLELGHEVWKAMLDEVDELIEVCGADLQIIGWYHTHPNSLPVFMSGTDRNTQKFMFGQEWQYAIVLNPHKQIWRSFYGKHSNECSGFFLAKI